MTKETKQEETITLYLDDYITLKDALEGNCYTLREDEFWHEDIRYHIADRDYGTAGSKLLQMQDQIDAIETIQKIEKERKKINENDKEKAERTITTLAKEFLSGKDKNN